ncbi:MAG TPA: IclR family transcriptional regulator C-terminal domain-containing protein [Steroidobacteraceae bacterium]|nr:IclR family transcriptional regulator C-terminal domain-containing protein [Steroidobacteraceae bacterium]
MESTRPIRALIRGLEALTVLNLRDGATVSELAQEIRLPRTTVYRILETLSNAGFIARDAGDDRYRLTARVRSLSGGFDDEAWVRQLARPFMEELGRELIWPISIATLAGAAVVIRDSTDRLSPLALERSSAGMRLPMLTSAAGRCLLAFTPPAEREPLLEALARSNREDDRLARGARTDLTRLLSDVRAQGYALTTRTRRLVEEVSLAVPILDHDRVRASLMVRFNSATLPQRQGSERLLPRLKQCAARISASFEEHKAAKLRASAQPVS